MKWNILINEKNCTGCLICQLICSWVNEGAFQPSHSLIKIDSDEKGGHFKISIDRSCNKCSLCASYCTSKALVKVKRQVEDD